MADERTLARRYARAFLDVAKAEEPKKIEALEQELQALAVLWRASPELRNVIAHPTVARAQKQSSVAAALAGKVSPLTLRFVRLLIDRKRLSLILDVAQEFADVADEAQGVVRAKVSSFMPLPAAQREKLLAKIRAFSARPNVRLEEKVDASLLGGILVRVGDQVLDGSVAGKLRKLREHLTLREDERSRQAAANAADTLN